MKVHNAPIIALALALLLVAGTAFAQKNPGGIRSRMEGSHTVDKRSWFELEIKKTRRTSVDENKDTTESRVVITAEVSYYVKDQDRSITEDGAAGRATRALREYLGDFSDEASRNNRRETAAYTEDMLAFYKLGDKPEWETEYEDKDKTWKCSSESVIIDEKITQYHVKKAQPARPQAPRPAPPPNFRQPGVIQGFR